MVARTGFRRFMGAIILTVISLSIVALQVYATGAHCWFVECGEVGESPS